MINIVTQVVLELNRTILFQVKLPHPSICVVTYPKELHSRRVDDAKNNQQSELTIVQEFNTYESHTDKKFLGTR